MTAILWPIGKDTNVTVNAANTEAQILKGSTVVLEDTFYAKPGESSITVNVNRYVESLLGSPNLDSLPWSSPLSRVANLSEFHYSDTAGSSASYKFLPSYVANPDIPLNPSSSSQVPSYPLVCLSRPIGTTVSGGRVLGTVKYVAGQYVLVTVYNCGSSTVSLSLGGTSFNVGAGQVFTAGIKTSCGQTYNVGNSIGYGWSGTVEAPYVLYYYNPFGGWDSFPFQGKALPSYSYERYSVINPRRFKYDYKVGKELRYTLNTGLLKDSESVLMDYIASSPSLYLHDIKADKIVRVRGDMDSLEKKTFKNQDRMFPSYEFQVVECQQEIRR